MRNVAGVMVLCILIAASGCASTQEAKSVEKSGFLGDYSMLKEGQRSAFDGGPGRHGPVGLQESKRRLAQIQKNTARSRDHMAG